MSKKLYRHLTQSNYGNIKTKINNAIKPKQKKETRKQST